MVIASQHISANNYTSSPGLKGFGGGTSTKGKANANASPKLTTPKGGLRDLYLCSVNDHWYSFVSF